MNSLDKYAYRLLSALVVIVIAGGTLFYHYVEKFSFMDAYYFSVVTLATVGYGDLSPHTAIGKLFTTIYIFAGVGIVTAYVSATFRRRGTKIKNHHVTKRPSDKDAD